MITSILTAVAGVGSAIAGGLYANFSARVMPRLGALPDAEGIATMQRFNRNAEMVPFMTVFFGTAALSATLLWRTIRDPHPNRAQIIAAVGSGLYLTGFIMTIVYHVPRNNALARVDANSVEALPVWHSYLSEWTAGNTVRAVISLAGAAALVTSSLMALEAKND